MWYFTCSLEEREVRSSGSVIAVRILSQLDVEGVNFPSWVQ